MRFVSCYFACTTEGSHKDQVSYMVIIVFN